jgi:hypothetical protein
MKNICNNCQSKIPNKNCMRCRENINFSVVSKELFSRQVSYTIELLVNSKEITISVNEDYNLNSDSISVDWEIIEGELTDEEFDYVDDWVNEFKYQNIEKVI